MNIHLAMKMALTGSKIQRSTMDQDSYVTAPEIVDHPWLHTRGGEERRRWCPTKDDLVAEDWEIKR